MATYYEELPQGLVVQCYLCKGPIREFVYRHQCDVRITKDRTLPEYCISCMIERKNCKRCKDSYSRIFSAVSIRASDELLQQIRAIDPRCTTQHYNSNKKRIPLIERAVVTTTYQTISNIPTNMNCENQLNKSDNESETVEKIVEHNNAGNVEHNNAGNNAGKMENTTICEKVEKRERTNYVILSEYLMIV